MKSNKGITLIALIITIIVLLILAVVAIRAVTGDGILGHAKTATSNYSREQNIEKLQLAVSAYKIAKHTGETTDTLGEWLRANGYPEATGTTECTVEMTSGTYTVTESAVTLATNNQVGGQGGAGGGGSTPVATTWTLTESTAEDNVTGLSVGDLVTASNGEAFYVIATPGANDTTVKLLARYNLTSAGTAQAPSETKANNTCGFSSTNYWRGVSGIAYPYTSGENAGKYPDLNDETTYPLGSATSDVKTRLQAYSTSLGVSARLMTVEEVVGLGGVFPCKENSWIGGTSSCPTFINSQNFWLGSAGNGTDVWNVYGVGSRLGSSGCDNDSVDYGYGVRPVIEISKSLIS